MYDELEKEKVHDCIECGCCLYSCPAHIPLLDIIRVSKAEVMNIMRNRSVKQ
jgi:electron transport complex protein RnfC